MRANIFNDVCVMCCDLPSFSQQANRDVIGACDVWVVQYLLPWFDINLTFPMKLKIFVYGSYQWTNVWVEEFYFQNWQNSFERRMTIFPGILNQMNMLNNECSHFVNNLFISNAKKDP